MSLQVDIVTPSQSAFSGPVNELRAQGFTGEFGVFPEHDHHLILLKPGVVVLSTGQGEKRFLLGSGFAEVGPDRVTLLTNHCEETSAIDKSDAQAQLADAEQRLDTEEFGSAKWELAKRDQEMAQARLDA